MAALKEKVKGSGIIYRKGERSEARRYNFSYIPHLVIADADGKQLYPFEARKVIAEFRKGNLANAVFEKARSFQ